jgi:hypothetical protein
MPHRRQKQLRQISCIVEGDADVFIIPVDPDLNIQHLKTTIYNAYFSNEGAASAADTTLRLWKVCAISNVARAWLNLTWL